MGPPQPWCHTFPLHICIISVMAVGGAPAVHLAGRAQLCTWAESVTVESPGLRVVRLTVLGLGLQAQQRQVATGSLA